MKNEEAAKELMMAYEDLKDMRYMDCGREAAFYKACETLKAEPCKDAISRPSFDLRVRAAVGMVEEELTEDFKDGIKMVLELLKAEPPVTPKPLDSVLDKIRAEIEPKCDRINSLASVLPYTAHREIQELLCEIMDLYKAESEGKE